MNRPIRQVIALVVAMFLVLMTAATYIQFFQAKSLNADSRNVRTLYDSYNVQRGQIIVGGKAIASSTAIDDLYKYQRSYSNGALYSNLTGYMSVTQNALTGLEKAANSTLSGQSDSLAGQRFSELFTGKTPAGGSVELTIDPVLQEAAAKALGNQRGAVVVLDPSTGAIKAQVSTPGFDPNQLATHSRKGADAAYTALNTDATEPLVDRATGGDQHAPGSSFKLVTAAAMLENNPQLTADSLVDAPLSYTPAGTTHQIWNPGRAACGNGSGKVTLQQAFVQSCNTTFAIGGVNVGADAMIKQAEKFGFNQSFTTPLAVSASCFPQPEDTAALAMDSFGQRDVRVTPMQMAMVGAAIANKGKLMKPYLVAKELNSDLETVSTTTPTLMSTPISERTATEMNKMMVAEVAEGTGYRAQIPGVTVAGKTGTAEINSTTPPDVWFVGYAPAESPKYVVAVMVENTGNYGWGGDGGSVAAPIAKQVLESKLG